jgi:hypothetical protein
VAKDFVTLGIGASPGSIEPFLLTGLFVGQAAVEPSAPPRSVIVGHAGTPARHSAAITGVDGIARPGASLAGAFGIGLPGALVVGHFGTLPLPNPAIAGCFGLQFKVLSVYSGMPWMGTIEV